MWTYRPQLNIHFLRDTSGAVVASAAVRGGLAVGYVVATDTRLTAKNVPALQSKINKLVVLHT
jgi:hypothetical protein